MYSWHHFLSAGIPMSHSDLDCDPNMVLIVGDSRVRSLCFQTQYQQSFVPMAKLEKVIELADLKLLNCPNAKFLFLIGLHCDFSHLEPWKEDKECSIMVTSHPDTDALLDKISAATFRWQNCYSELVVIWTLPYTPDFYVFNSMQVQQSKCKNALSVAQMNDFARDYNSLCSAIVSGWKTKMSHPPFQMVTLCPQTGLKQDNRLPFEGCTVDGLHPHPKTCQDFWPQLFRFAIAFKKSHSQGKYHWLDSPHKTFDEANSCIELSVSQSNQSSGLKIPTLISGFSRTNKMKPSTKPNKLVPVNQRELQKICNSSTAVTEKKVMFPIKSETDIPPKLHPKAYSELNSEIPNELLEIDLPDIEVVLGSVSVNTGSVETDKQGVKIESLSKQVDVQKSESVKIETVQNDECNSQLMKKGKVPLLKVIASQVIEKCGQPVSKVLLKISGGLQSKETKGDETYSVPKPNKKSMLELHEDAEPYVESEYEAREEISNTNKEIDPESKGQVIDGHTAKKTVYSSTSNLNNSESQPQSKANPLEEYYETLSPVGEMPLKELETEEVMSEENDFDFVENSSISSLSDWEFMENCSNSDQVTGVASCPPTVTECMEIKSRTSTLVMQKPGAPSKTLPINKNKDYPATTRSSTHSLLPNESYERKLLSNSSVEGLRQKNLFPQDAGHESRFCGVSGSISVEVGSAGFRPRLSGSQSPPILSLVRTQSKEKVFKSRSRDKISFFSLSPQRSLSPFSPPLRLKSPFHFSRRSRSPLPYSRKSRSPLPYSRRSRSPLPYSRRSRSPLPYSRRSRSPLPYSRRSRSPLPYSRRSRSPLPYSRRSRSPLLFSRRSRSPLPYSRKSQSPLSFSQRSSFLQRSPVASRVRRSSRSSSVSRQKPFHRLKSRSPSKSQSRSEMKKSTNSKHLRSERSSKHSEATPRRTVRSSSKERLKSRFLSKESKSRISKKSKKSRSISTERSKSPFAILSKGNSTSSFLQKRKKSRSRSRCRYENYPRSRTSSSKSQISSRSRAKEISRPQPDTINRSPVNPKTHDRCSDFENRILKRVKKSKTPLRSSDSKSTRRFPPENSRKGSEGISLPSLSKNKKTKEEEQKLEKEEGKMPIDCKEIIDDASLRTCLGNELYEKFCQEKQQRFVQLEEEFEVYKTMPDLYPDYEKIYESFVTNFMTQSLRHSEEEEERLWMKFWHLQFYHIKQRCWEQRLAQLMQDFRQKADEKRGAKEVPTLITKSNEVDKTLDILSSMVPDFGVLGPSVSSIIAAVKERGPTSNEAYRLLADPDNALLLELALKKLSPGQRALAEEHTMRLLKQATEAVKESGLNLEAIAQASLGKDPVYILNLIKTAVKVEGLETSDKLINEFFLRVCELHFEMAMHSDEQK